MANANTPELHSLLGAHLWRATEHAQVHATSTGFQALDALLPGGGWPNGAVSEILHPHIGVGEMSLALPLLAKLTHTGHPVALVTPPHVPHAPRLLSDGLKLEQVLIVDADDSADALWSAELLLRAGGSVLMWADRIDTQSLRRLQLAAESSEQFALLIRPDRFARDSTPSALRLHIRRERGIPQVEVLKCRGARRGQSSLIQPPAVEMRAA